MVRMFGLSSCMSVFSLICESLFAFLGNNLHLFIHTVNLQCCFYWWVAITCKAPVAHLRALGMVYIHSVLCIVCNFNQKPFLLLQHSQSPTRHAHSKNYHSVTHMNYAALSCFYITFDKNQGFFHIIVPAGKNPTMQQPLCVKK